MSAKRKDEAKGLEATQRSKLSGRFSKTFVTFRNGHMHLDVKGYLASREGRESVQKVIRLSQGLPQKPQKKKRAEESQEPGAELAI